MEEEQNEVLQLDDSSIEDSATEQNDNFIREVLVVEKSESDSQDEIDEDESDHSSDNECFRPDTPVSEIEEEQRKEKERNFKEKEARRIERQNEKIQRDKEKQTQNYRKATQASTCCLLV